MCTVHILRIAIGIDEFFDFDYKVTYEWYKVTCDFATKFKLNKNSHLSMVGASLISHSYQMLKFLLDLTLFNINNEKKAKTLNKRQRHSSDGAKFYLPLRDLKLANKYCDYSTWKVLLNHPILALKGSRDVRMYNYNDKLPIAKVIRKYMVSGLKESSNQLFKLCFIEKNNIQYNETIYENAIRTVIAHDDCEVFKIFINKFYRSSFLDDESYYLDKSCVSELFELSCLFESWNIIEFIFNDLIRVRKKLQLDVTINCNDYKYNYDEFIYYIKKHCVSEKNSSNIFWWLYLLYYDSNKFLSDIRKIWFDLYSHIMDDTCYNFRNYFQLFIKMNF